MACTYTTFSILQFCHTTRIINENDTHKSNIKMLSKTVSLEFDVPVNGSQPGWHVTLKWHWPGVGAGGCKDIPGEKNKQIWGFSIILKKIVSDVFDPISVYNVIARQTWIQRNRKYLHKRLVFPTPYPIVTTRILQPSKNHPGDILHSFFGIFTNYWLYLSDRTVV